MSKTYNRYIVLDEFGDALRKFSTEIDAKVFMRNKNGCKLQEISLYDILGECLL